MRTGALSLLLLLLTLLGVGCANSPDSRVLAGLLLGLPGGAAGGGNSAELTVFLGHGASALDVAANTIDDAELVFGTAGGVTVELPHIADGFYIGTSVEDPTLRYVPEVSWDIGADFSSQRVQVGLEAPAGAGLFGAPLDGLWTTNRELTLTLGADGADRAFGWVNDPSGEVSWTDEPPTAAELLRWLATDPGVPEVVIPGEAFPVPGTYRIVVVASQDADSTRFVGASGLSTFSAGLSTELFLDVQ